MNGLQILRHQVCISPRHLKCRVSKHLLEMKDAPALAEIVDRKSVTHRMNRPSRRLEAQRTAQHLEIPQHIPASLFRPAQRREDEAIFLRFTLALKEEQSSPQFERHRDKSILPALAVK